MATYNEKKKLLEENQDIYISEYDKSLPPATLSKIIEQKKEYKKAEKIGDTQGMNNANAKANSLRMEHGNYHGGYDGSEFNTTPQNYEVGIYKQYVSPYEKEREKVLNKISQIKDFSYDYETDPVFKAYYALYQKLGDDAYERALAKNALRTGGMVSSSAISSAQSAKNHYNSMIAEKIPDLYKDAYSRYNNEYKMLYDKLNILSKLDDTQYSRFRDSIKDMESDREFSYKKQQDSLNRFFDSYKYDSDMEYKRERDDELDNQWEKELEESIRKNELTGIVNLAKVLFGKTPISSSVISNLYSLIK